MFNNVYQLMHINFWIRAFYPCPLYMVGSITIGILYEVGALRVGEYFCVKQNVLKTIEN